MAETPYDYTQVTVHARDDGTLGVTISLMRADGTRKHPRLLRAPWEHTYTIGSDVTVESLFWRIKAVLQGLAEAHGTAPRPKAPAPPEGATGGPEQ